MQISVYFCPLQEALVEDTGTLDEDRKARELLEEVMRPHEIGEVDVLIIGTRRLGVAVEAYDTEAGSFWTWLGVSRVSIDVSVFRSGRSPDCRGLSVDKGRSNCD